MTVYNSATNAYVIVPAYNLLEVVLTTIDDGTVNFTHTNLSGIDELGVHFGSHKANDNFHHARMAA